MGLGELEAGDTLLSRYGLVTVAQVTSHPAAPVYNISVQQQHVYEVTEWGIVVHNNDLCKELQELRKKKQDAEARGEKLSDADQKRLGELEEKARNGEFGAPSRASVRIDYEEGWNRRDFGRKTRALQDLAERGKLRKAPNPVDRDPSITRKYKNDLIRLAYYMYGKSDPKKFQSLRDRILRMQADHVHELQLSGLDEATNLSLLDADVNIGIGRQIWQQIRNLPDGTIIEHIDVGGF